MTDLKENRMAIITTSEELCNTVFFSFLHYLTRKKELLYGCN